MSTINAQSLMEDGALLIALKDIKIAAPQQYKQLMKAFSIKLEREMNNLLETNPERLPAAQGRTRLMYELMERMDHCEELSVKYQERAKILEGQNRGSAN